jgi:hypothetical protein
MADTNRLKTQVEPYVRSWLETRYGKSFRCHFLPLAGCCGRHEFDAVSQDDKIIAAIKCSSGKTSGKKNPSGKISSLYEELYFLAGTDAETRLVVLTNREFFELAKKRTSAKLARNIQILHCALPLVWRYWSRKYARMRARKLIAVKRVSDRRCLARMRLVLRRGAASAAPLVCQIEAALAAEVLCCAQCGSTTAELFS